MGSYKCVPKLKKKTKLLQEEDYDAEDDDEEDDDYDDDGITESSSYESSCELGFKKDENGEKCVGELEIFLYICNIFYDS